MNSHSLIRRHVGKQANHDKICLAIRALLSWAYDRVPRRDLTIGWNIVSYTTIEPCIVQLVVAKDTGLPKPRAP